MTMSGSKKAAAKPGPRMASDAGGSGPAMRYQRPPTKKADYTPATSDSTPSPPTTAEKRSGPGASAACSGALARAALPG
jgi:hypothetical protein